MKKIKEAEKMDRAARHQALQKGYGIERPERISGYAGLFFTLGDVCASDWVAEWMDQSEAFRAFVFRSLEAFFESESFEDAIRNAISIGGDSDTIAAITGGVAEAYYGVPEEIRDMALSYLDDTEMEILIAFSERYVR